MGVKFNQRQKYGNKKTVVDGIGFDSKLELYCYNTLKQCGIDFDFQVPITLQEGFKFKGASIRKIEMRVDFFVKVNGGIWLDTKGFPTPDAKIKYKILKYKEKDSGVDVVWVKNQKEVKEFISNILNK